MKLKREMRERWGRERREKDGEREEQFCPKNKNLTEIITA